MITLKYFGALRQLTGKTQESIAAKKIRSVLKYLRQTYGKETALKAKRCLILINNDNINLHQGMSTALKPGDTVGFVPVCAGG